MCVCLCVDKIQMDKHAYYIHMYVHMHIDINRHLYIYTHIYTCYYIFIYTHTYTQLYPGKGNGNPLQYSCLENSMDRGAWRAAVCGNTESDMIE